MTGWYLVWILVIRSGAEFHITPNERPVGSIEECQRQKIVLEKQFFENPVDWGDATSYSIRCEYRGAKK
jgi:hypothetical protein